MQPRRRASAVLIAALAVGAVLVGCTAPAPPATPRAQSPSPTASPTPTQPPAPVLELPTDPVSVVGEADPVQLAAAASAALYRSAPLAVVAAHDDPTLLAPAASATVALGAPLLLADPDDPGPVQRELDRLGSEAVLVFGADLNLRAAGRTLVIAPEDAADLADLLDLRFADVAAVDADVLAREVAGLDRDAPVLLTAPTPEPEPEPAEPTSAPSDTATPDTASTTPESPPDTSAPSSSGEPTSAPSTADPSSAEPASSASLTLFDGFTLPATPSATPTDRARPSPPAELPATTQPPAATDLVVLTTGTLDQAGAVATARAAGAQVLRVFSGDPRRHPGVIAALADDAPGTVLALGPAFGSADDLAWKVATARTGVELPGGGQVLFPGRRLIALYGHPAGPALGVLGEQDLDATVTRARAQARKFDDLTDDTVVPAFEIIATIASAEAGDDGDYSRETPVAQLLPYVEAAAEAGIYVVLDLQPGRTDFLTQAKRYEELLRYPHVGLALDPEWRLEPNQRHLRQIGSVDVKEVNKTLIWLADLTREHHLPQKLLILHQFQTRMISNREDLDTSRDEIAVLIHADGQGSQPAKQETWRTLRRDAPDGVFWGWKNFYDEDSPMLTTRQTFEDVDPVPEFVSYQ